MLSSVQGTPPNGGSGGNNTGGSGGNNTGGSGGNNTSPWEFDLRMLSRTVRMQLSDAQRRWAVEGFLRTTRPPPEALLRGAAWAKAIGRDGVPPGNARRRHRQPLRAIAPGDTVGAGDEVVAPGTGVPPREVHGAVVGVIAAILSTTGGPAIDGDPVGAAADMVDGVEPQTALHLSVLSQMLRHDDVRDVTGGGRGIGVVSTELVAAAHACCGCVD